MSDRMAAAKPDAGRNPAAMRRKLYIKERLPTVLAEMKALADERKELLDKRKQAQPEERRQINQRWNFIVERLEALRAERAALIEERDGMPQPPAKAKALQKP